MRRYYESQNILTLLQSSDEKMYLDNHKIELFCNALTGETVNWSQEIDWVKCIHDMNEGEDTIINGASVGSELAETKSFQREKIHGKSELDHIDHLSRSTILTRPLQTRQNDSIVFKDQSKFLTMPLLNGNDGAMLANFWKSMEKEFIENMERCFFFRRILISEQEPFIAAINKHVNEMLHRPNDDKIKIIRHLQSDLCRIPYSALEIPDVLRQLHVSVSDAKHLLTQLSNKRIETCRLFIRNENVENWLDKQITSLSIVYTFMLQTEVRSTLYSHFNVLFNCYYLIRSIER